MTGVHTRENMLRLAPMVEAGAPAGPPSGSRSATAVCSPWRRGTSCTGPSAGPLPPAPEPPCAGLQADVPAGAGAHHDHRRGQGHDRPVRQRRRLGQEAGYDGIQLASSNARCSTSSSACSGTGAPDEARRVGLRKPGPAARGESGGDRRTGRGRTSTRTVKVPVGEKAPPLFPASTLGRGAPSPPGAVRGVRLGRPRVTPVDVGVPDTTLNRGGVPAPLWRNTGMKARFVEGVAHPPKRKGRSRPATSWVASRAPSPAGWNRQSVRGGQGSRCRSLLAVGGRRPHRGRGRRESSRRPGRPCGGGPALHAELDVPAGFSAEDGWGRVAAGTPTSVPPRCSA